MRKKSVIVAMMCLACLLAGCGKNTNVEKVVLTAGFQADEVFRIEDISCSKTEIMLLLTNTQNQYKSVYGEEILEKDFNGITLEEQIKENILAKISQIKTMNLLAREQNVNLDEEEIEKVKEAAEAYYASLNETEKEKMQLSQEIVENLYYEYALAQKVYRYIIRDINPEISDDEARTVTVQHILFKTYEVDGTGQKVDYSEDAKADTYMQAQEVLRIAKSEDGDFEQLMVDYSDSEEGTISFGKGEMETAFEEIAFNLETGEISEIIETSYGYHIIKCMNTFNREETDANKIKIVEKRRQEVFGQEYETYAQTLTKKLNEDLWDDITLFREEAITTRNFYEIYEEYIQK